MVSLDLLPHFILNEIFSYLEVYELKFLRPVNKSWNSALAPLVSRELNFSSGDDTIKRFYERHGRHATAINFDSVFNAPLNLKSIKLITSSCQNIRALDIKVSKHWKMASKFILALSETQNDFSHLSLRDLITTDLLNSIGPALAKLESLELGCFGRKKGVEAEKILDALHCPRLKILTLWIPYAKVSSPDRLQARFPTLKLINLVETVYGPRQVLHRSIQLNPTFVKMIRLNLPVEGLLLGLEFQKTSDYPLDGPSEDKSIAAQIENIESNFLFDQATACGLESLFANLKKMHFVIYDSFWGACENLFPRLCEVETLLINFNESSKLFSSDTIFRCKVLSLDLGTWKPHISMDWLASHCPALEMLYVQSAVVPWEKVDSKFNSLVKFYSQDPQPLEFWTLLVASSPALKYVYLSSKDTLFKELEAKFPTVKFFIWDGVLGHLWNMHDLTGYEFDVKTTLRLLDKGRVMPDEFEFEDPRMLF